MTGGSITGRPQRGRTPVVESSGSAAADSFLHASASQYLMLMRECNSLSLPSGFAALLPHLSPRTIDANDLPEAWSGSQTTVINRIACPTYASPSQPRRDNLPSAGHSVVKT